MFPSSFNKYWASEVAQQVKALSIKSVDLGSLPGTHMLEGENQLLKVVL